MKKLFIKKRTFSLDVNVGSYYKATFQTKWTKPTTIVFKLSGIDAHQKSTVYLYAENDRYLDVTTGEIRRTHQNYFNGAALKVADITDMVVAGIPEARALRCFLLNKTAAI
jgi:hypothetical protein